MKDIKKYNLTFLKHPREINQTVKIEKGHHFLMHQECNLLL